VPCLLIFSTAIACTGDGTAPGEGPTSVAPSDDGVVNRDAGTTEFVPGRFIYQYNSITAQATFRENVATMNVRNGSGVEIGAPALYVIGADDRRYDAQVHGAAPLGEGGSATLEFVFPQEVAPDTIGLAVLSFGEDNVGAMSPVPRP
jgi:hypothetical protein